MRIRTVICVAIVSLVVMRVIADIDVRGAPCNVAGSVVDQTGAPLQGVEIEVVITELVDLQPVRYSTNVVVDATFNLVFPIVAELDIIARKDGYIAASAHLNRRELNADDILLRMNTAPPPTQLVQVKGVDVWLDYEGKGTGVALETGEVVSLADNPDLFFAFPNEWTPTNNMPPSVLRMHVAPGGGLFNIPSLTEKYSRQDIAACVEAPTDGYLAEIDLPLGGEASPLFFFKTPSGIYGKLQIRVLNAIHRHQKIVARLEYFLQPDGTRNLNNFKRLKLIRAKKRIVPHR